jgi:microcystin-dependent protein
MHVPVVSGAFVCDEYQTTPTIGTRYSDARIGRVGETNKMQQYVGQVIAVGFNFAPEGWVLCNGQLLSISEFSVLYTLIGTTFGGDGVNTFGVPNLNGRSPAGQGTGPGLPTMVLGQAAGTESVTLTSNQLPAHNHVLSASSATGTTATPSSSTALSNQSNGSVTMYGAAPGNTTLAAGAISPAGSSLPHENRQPYNTVNYIISLFGIFPSQS